MLTLICGLDVVAAHKYYTQLQDHYKKQNLQIYKIPVSDLEQIRTISEQGTNLFGNQGIFFTRNIQSLANKKEKIKVIQELAENSSLQLVSLEEVAGWELSKNISKLGEVKEFKPQYNIFQLLDSLVPGKGQTFIKLLRQISTDVETTFIYTMICRHVRAMLISQYTDLSGPIWQTKKVKNQGALWDKTKLMNFYESLFKLDIAMKTNNENLPLIKNLELLGVFYLQ